MCHDPIEWTGATLKLRRHLSPEHPKTPRERGRVPIARGLRARHDRMQIGFRSQTHRNHIESGPGDLGASRSFPRSQNLTPPLRPRIESDVCRDIPKPTRENVYTCEKKHETRSGNLTTRPKQTETKRKTKQNQRTRQKLMDPGTAKGSPVTTAVPAAKHISCSEAALAKHVWANRPGRRPGRVFGTCCSVRPHW